MSSISPLDIKAWVESSSGQKEQLLGEDLNNNFNKIVTAINNLNFANVRDFGAVGNNTNDDTEAFNDAIVYCKANGLALYIPDGIYKITSQLEDLVNTSVYGQSITNTIIKPVFASLQSVFVGTKTAHSRISNFTISGPTQLYTGNERAITLNPAYSTFIDNIFIEKCRIGINLTDCWGSSLKNIRLMYTQSPLVLKTPNGVLMQRIYIQQYKGNGIELESGLSTKADTIIIEHGQADSVGIQLSGMQNFKLDTFYTEGTMLEDIKFNLKSSRRNINTTLSNMWLNSTATKIIHATACSGLTIENAVVQTPQATSLIYHDDASPSTIYVENVCQVDQNANSFTGDVRDTGQTLIPISTHNNRVVLKNGHPKVGNGTDADLSNIANHTTLDSYGNRPVISSPYTLKQTDIQQYTKLTCSGGTTGTITYNSTGITINARDYGSIPISVTGVVTHGSATQPFFRMAFQNATSSEVGEAVNTSVASSGSTYTHTFYVPVVPGVNLLKLGISREQGGGGTNTFTCSNFDLV